MTAAPKLQMVKNLYSVGEIPPLGHVPEEMYAWAIRRERHGPPLESMQIEVVPTWPIGENCLPPSRPTAMYSEPA